MADLVVKKESFSDYQTKKQTHSEVIDGIHGLLQGYLRAKQVDELKLENPDEDFIDQQRLIIEHLDALNAQIGSQVKSCTKYEKELIVSKLDLYKSLKTDKADTFLCKAESKNGRPLLVTSMKCFGSEVATRRGNKSRYISGLEVEWNRIHG